MITDVIVVPGTVGALHLCEPVVGEFGLSGTPRNIECHRGFNMVPRVAMTVREPGNHSRRTLQRRKMSGGCGHLIGSDHARKVRNY